jgi:hypothetical protein
MGLTHMLETSMDLPYSGVAVDATVNAPEKPPVVRRLFILRGFTLGGRGCR